MNSDDYPGLEAKVKLYAVEWLQHANLKFEWVAPTATADVKIGFEYGDDFPLISWAVIGTDCQSVPQDESTLNFVALEEEEEEIIRAEVLRGFGHVLGLGFEHRSPNSLIEFKYSTSTEKKRLTGYFGMLLEDIMSEVISQYQLDQTNYTEYDDNSIMRIPIPMTILKYPPQTIGDYNIELSAMDKAFVKELYPKMWLKKLNINDNITKLIGGASLYAGANNTLYALNYCGIYKIDLNGAIPTANLITNHQVSPFHLQILLDNKLFYLNSSANIVCYVDLTNGAIVNTQIQGNIMSIVKANDETFYYGGVEGLRYIDKNTGVVNPLNLITEGMPFAMPDTYQASCLKKDQNGKIFAIVLTGVWQHIFEINTQTKTAIFKFTLGCGTSWSSFTHDNCADFSNGKIYLKNGGNVYGFKDNAMIVSDFLSLGRLGGTADGVFGNDNNIYYYTDKEAFRMDLTTHQIQKINRPANDRALFYQYVTPFSAGVSYLLERIEDNVDGYSIIQRDLYYVDYLANDIIEKVSLGKAMPWNGAETTNGDVYFTSYYMTNTISESGIYKLMR